MYVDMRYNCWQPQQLFFFASIFFVAPLKLFSIPVTSLTAEKEKKILAIINSTDSNHTQLAHDFTSALSGALLSDFSARLE